MNAAVIEDMLTTVLDGVLTPKLLLHNTVSVCNEYLNEVAPEGFTGAPVDAPVDVPVTVDYDVEIYGDLENLIQVDRR